MRLDTQLPGGLPVAAEQARVAERDGFDAVWTTDTAHDPFLPLLPAATATSTIAVGTGIAVAFARSPMTVAQTAWDLQAHSEGRFLLGLGSQIRPHIERRFSMPWSKPAARMREYVLALRAIWTSWQHGTPLDFAGEFYTHTLMPPYFRPEPLRGDAPPIFVAAVGKDMTRVCAEVADGILLHRFITADYLRAQALPAIEAGLARAGRDRGSLQVACPAFVVTGDTDDELAHAAAATRDQIAFYASTPAYRPVLDEHGWGELQPELRELTRQDRWSEMKDLIDEEMLAAFAVIGTPEQCGTQLVRRFGDLVDRLSPNTLYEVPSRVRARIATAARAALASGVATD